MAFEAGEWEEARAHLSPEPDRLTGVLLIVRHMRGIEQDLAMGNPDGARAALDAVEPLVCDSEEPQWIALYGVLRAAQCRREGDLDGAQRAIAEALDRLELCTDDVMRIARVSAGGIAVEADRAQRGRDLHERSEVRDALARARIHMDRLKAAATEGGAVERTLLAEGRADLARASGRATVRDWQRAADAWREIERPYPEARCRRHVAEIALMAGDRDTACAIAGEVLTVAERLGAIWLAGEVRALIERGRLNVVTGTAGHGAGGSDGAEIASAPSTDPFGLTARERQVLALVAEGATNRQIGDALFMAEKTASVHVSRILAKLGVSGRTQAAAIAHRQHLT